MVQKVKRVVAIEYKIHERQCAKERHRKCTVNKKATEEEVF